MLTCLTLQVGPEDKVITLDHSCPRRFLISVRWLYSHPAEVELDSQSPATLLGPRGPEGSLVPQTGCHMSAVARKGGLVRAGDRLPNRLSAHPTIRCIRD